MITLPANFISNFNRPAVYIVRMTGLSEGAPVDFFLGNQPELGDSIVCTYLGEEIGMISDALAAVIGSSLAGETAVNGIGEMDFQVSAHDGGGVSPVNETELVLLKMREYTGVVYDFENQPVEIWEGRMPAVGVTTFAIDTECVCRFKGIMMNAGTYDHNRYTIPIVDMRAKDDRVIPWKRVTESAFPRAPKESLGQIFPILIGNMDQDENTGRVKPWELGKFNAPPSVLVDKVFSQYYVCAHENLLNNLTLFIVSNPDDWIGIVDQTRFTIDPDTDGVEYANLLFDLFGEAWVIPKLPEDVVYGPIPNIGNMVDGDPDTYAILSFTYPTTAQQARFRFESRGEPGTLQNRRYANAYGPTSDMKICLEATASDDPANWYVQVYNSESGASSAAVLTVADGVNRIEMNLNAVYDDLTWAQMFETMEIRIGHILNVGPINATLTVRALWIQARTRFKTNYLETKVVVKDVMPMYWRTAWNVHMLVPLREQAAVEQKSSAPSLFPAAYGFQYGSWITGRGTGYVSGDFIENPAYAIEWLLRNSLGLPEARLDLPSFDAVGNQTDGTRRYWKIAASITNQGNAIEEHIARICFEFGLKLDLTPMGTYRLISLDDATPVFAITDDDIAIDDSTGRPLVDVSATPNEKIYNDFFLTYRNNYASNQTEKEVYISDIDDDGVIQENFAVSANTGAPRATTYTGYLADSRARYGARRPFTTKLQFIRDVGTAERCVKKLADWWAFRMCTVRLELLKNLNTLALQKGDIVTVTNDQLTPARSGFTHFLIDRIGYPGVGLTSGPNLVFELLEVPNDATGIPVSTGWFHIAETAFLTSDLEPFHDVTDTSVRVRK
jgi:hypothetical protein